MSVYGAYDQAGLDAQYDNRAMIPDFADYLARWARDSAVVREDLPCRLDLAYGPGPRQRLDFFPAATADAPVHVFIHGGYWRALGKDSFSYPAPAFVATGVAYVALGYPLAPAHTMDEIVASVRAALAWLWRNCAAAGGDPDRITVSGHSAGGHLAAMALSTDWAAHDDDGGPLPADLVKAATAISGLYDLEPIRLCYLNADLGLDADSVRRTSPLHQVPARAGPLALAVGGLESAEYHRQQDAYAAAWRARSLPLTSLELAELHHLAMVDQLALPASRLHCAVREQILSGADAERGGRTAGRRS